MEKGLYKKLNESEMIFAKNEINYPDGTVITVSNHENDTGEIKDGWYWFNSRDEAVEYFGIKEIELPQI